MSETFSVGERVRVLATNELGTVDAALMDSVNVHIDGESSSRHFTADELVHDLLSELGQSVRRARGGAGPEPAWDDHAELARTLREHYAPYANVADPWAALATSLIELGWRRDRTPTPNPMVVHGSIGLERDDGDGELHATCKCGVKATFTDEPDGRSAHVAAQEWWQQHQREATDEEDQFGTTCTECLAPLDDAHPYGTNADGDFVHYACADDSPTPDPVILQHPAGYTLAEQVQAVWDEEGPDGVADAIRRVARGEGT